MKESTVDIVMKVLPFTVLAIAVLIGIACTPLLFIAMVNALFPTAGIACGFMEWCAVMMILLIIKFGLFVYEGVS